MPNSHSPEERSSLDSAGPGMPDFTGVGMVGCACFAALIVLSLAWQIELLNQQLEDANRQIEVLELRDRNGNQDAMRAGKQRENKQVK